MIPIVPIPFPDPEINTFFEQLDQTAGALAKRGSSWTTSDDGHELFQALIYTAETRCPGPGRDVLRLGICAGMPPAAADTSRAMIAKLPEAMQPRAHELLEAEQGLDGGDLFAMAEAVEGWRTWAESLQIGSGAAIAFACGLIWVRLHQRHGARVFVLP